MLKKITIVAIGTLVANVVFTVGTVMLYKPVLKFTMKQVNRTWEDVEF